jgi:hypothetical protein
MMFQTMTPEERLLLDTIMSEGYDFEYHQFVDGFGESIWGVGAHGDMIFMDCSLELAFSKAKEYFGR